MKKCQNKKLCSSNQGFFFNLYSGHTLGVKCIVIRFTLNALGKKNLALMSEMPHLMRDICNGR